MTYIEQLIQLDQEDTSRNCVKKKKKKICS